MFGVDYEYHELAYYVKNINNTLKNIFKRNPVNTRTADRVKRSC